MEVNIEDFQKKAGADLSKDCPELGAYVVAGDFRAYYALRSLPQCLDSNGNFNEAQAECMSRLLGFEIDDVEPALRFLNCFERYLSTDLAVEHECNVDECRSMISACREFITCTDQVQVSTLLQVLKCKHDCMWYHRSLNQLYRLMLALVDLPEENLQLLDEYDLALAMGDPDEEDDDTDEE